MRFLFEDQASCGCQTLSGGSDRAFGPGPDLPGDPSGTAAHERRGARDGPVVGGETVGLHNPRGDRGDAEIAADSHEDEDQIDAVRHVEIPVVVLRHHLGIVLQREGLQPGDDGREEVGDGKPQVDGDVLGKPLHQGVLKPVENRDGKGDGPEQREDNQVEGPQYVEDHARRGEEELHDCGEGLQNHPLDAPRLPLALHPVEGLLRLLVDAQGLQLALLLLVLGVVALCRKPFAALLFEACTLLPPLLHVEGLADHQ